MGDTIKHRDRQPLRLEHAGLGIELCGVHRGAGAGESAACTAQGHGDERGAVAAERSLGYPDGPNTYSYCGTSPIGSIDPLGLHRWGRFGDQYWGGPPRYQVSEKSREGQIPTQTGQVPNQKCCVRTETSVIAK